MTEPSTTPTPAPEPTAQPAETVSAPAAQPAPAPESGPKAGPPAAATPVQAAVAGPPASTPAAEPVVAHSVDGSKPEQRGLIGWLNYYAEDLLAPISKPGRSCERCKRKMWRGYFASAPTGVSGISDVQIVCWRCKLAAAQQEIERLRTAGRR